MYRPDLDHGAIVATAREKFAALPPGPERSWKIVNEAALLLTGLGEDAGILSKPAGYNYNGYATDVVVYKDGTHYDALGDAGISDRPQWLRIAENVDPSRWRAPIGAVIPPPTPEPEPEPVPPVVDLTPITLQLSAIIAYQLELHALIKDLRTRLDQAFTVKLRF